MSTEVQYPLRTKRSVIGQVVMCRGCCCGEVRRGKPEVPVEWMKEEWKRRGLLKNLQLSISGCLGPCDLSNVVTVSGPAGLVWLGGLHRFGQYSALVDWASQCKAEGHMLPLPSEFDELRFDPFQSSVSHGLEKL